MQNPINLQIAHVVNLVAGVSPAYTSVPIVAAPGAGFRLRIWKFGTSGITGIAAGSFWHAYWRPIDDSFRIACSGAREAFQPGIDLPGGIVLPENVGWEISVSATGASRTMPSWTAYTIEAVS